MPGEPRWEQPSRASVLACTSPGLRDGGGDGAGCGAAGSAPFCSREHFAGPLQAGGGRGLASASPGRLALWPGRVAGARQAPGAVLRGARGEGVRGRAQGCPHVCSVCSRVNWSRS